MSLFLEWEGKKRHRLDQQYKYRYIYPSHTEPGLSSFYGPDRSFCQGMIFDTTDFVIEFNICRETIMEPIYHHPSSYRSNLNRDNVTIVAIYVKQNSFDYNQMEFEQHLQTLITQVPSGITIYRYKNCDDLTGRHVVLTSVWKKV